MPRTKVGGQKPEVRSQKSEVRSQKSEVRSQKLADSTEPEKHFFYCGRPLTNWRSYPIDQGRGVQPFHSPVFLAGFFLFRFRFFVFFLFLVVGVLGAGVVAVGWPPVVSGCG